SQRPEGRDGTPPSGAEQLIVLLKYPAEGRTRTAEVDSLGEVADRQRVARFRGACTLEVAKDDDRALRPAERFQRLLHPGDRLLREQRGLGRVIDPSAEAIEPVELVGSVVHPPRTGPGGGQRPGARLTSAVAARLVEHDRGQPGSQTGASLEGVEPAHRM